VGHVSTYLANGPPETITSVERPRPRESSEEAAVGVGDAGAGSERIGDYGGAELILIRIAAVACRGCATLLTKLSRPIRVLAPIDRSSGRRSGRSAIDEDLCTLHVRSFVGSEVENGIGDMLGFTDAPQRRAA
jgi:hypothetical protein